MGTLDEVVAGARCPPTAPATTSSSVPMWRTLGRAPAPGRRVEGDRWGPVLRSHLRGV